jgi:hypothetical protein
MKETMQRIAKRNVSRRQKVHGPDCRRDVAASCLVSALLMASLLSVAGCKPATDAASGGGTVAGPANAAEAKSAMDKQIQDINDNKYMTADQKARQIAVLQANSQGHY